MWVKIRLQDPERNTIKIKQDKCRYGLNSFVRIILMWSFPEDPNFWYGINRKIP